MTDTANAPERIKAWMQPYFSEIGSWSTTRYPEVTIEYVLATHCDELVAAAYLDAARVPTGFLVGDPPNGIPLRNPMAHEVAEAIKAQIPDDARAALTARDERMKAEGAKEEREKWQRPTRDTFDAMCAMRDAINEHVPMPSLESDLLHGPENSVFCATVAESVIDAQKKAQAKIARLTMIANELSWSKKTRDISNRLFAALQENAHG